MNFLIFLSLTFYVALSLQVSTNTFLIKNILDNFHLNSFKVIYFSCNKQESFSVMKTLSNSGHYVNTIDIERVKNVPHAVLPHNKLVFVVETCCNGTESLILKSNELQLFAAPYRWIFLVFSAKNSQTLAEIDAFVDSDVSVVEENREVGGFSLYKLYKLDEKLIREDFGRVNREFWFDVVEEFERNSAVRRKNLRLKNLNTCLVITHNDTFKHLLDKRQKHLDSIAKVNYVFMLHLKDILNSTMNFSVESTWGYKDKNSNWNGMIGELTTKRADIGGTPLFFTSDRVFIIDYIAMTTPTKSKFVFRQPKLSYITNVFTLPFNTSVWISSIALVAVTALSLYLVVKWEWYKKRVYSYKDEAHSFEPELKDSMVDVFFVAFGAVCQQGTNAVPYTSAGRVITILLFISLMFLYTSYSANIVALLQSSSTSIQTLEDLLKSRLQVGVDDTVFNHFFFPNATEPVRRALYLQKVAPPGQKARYFPIDEGVRRMRQGLFAFHMETGAGYKIVGETFMEDEKCGLNEIQFLQVPDPWLAIQKNSSFKEMLKIGLRKIQESGLQQREVSLLYTKKPRCISRGSSFVGVGIVDCYPAAVVLAGGAAGATCIFLLEIFYHQYVHIIDKLHRKFLK